MPEGGKPKNLQGGGNPWIAGEKTAKTASKNAFFSFFFTNFQVFEQKSQFFAIFQQKFTIFALFFAKFVGLRPRRQGGSTFRSQGGGKPGKVGPWSRHGGYGFFLQRGVSWQSPHLNRGMDASGTRSYEVDRLRKQLWSAPRKISTRNEEEDASDEPSSAS